MYNSSPESAGLAQIHGFASSTILRFKPGGGLLGSAPSHSRICGHTDLAGRQRKRPGGQRQQQDKG